MCIFHSPWCEIHHSLCIKIYHLYLKNTATKYGHKRDVDYTCKIQNESVGNLFNFLLMEMKFSKC